jgi:hypothetical protein
MCASQPVGGSSHGDNDHQFALAEFVQMYEQIRNRETAIVQLVTVVLVASTSLLSAVGVYFFDKLPRLVAAAYLFLAPLMIIIPGLTMIRAQRRDIYRMGTYLKIFHEHPPSGAKWSHGLIELRQVHYEESQDYVPVAFWTLSFLSFALFWTALSVVAPVDWSAGGRAWLSTLPHWFAPVPLMALLTQEHIAFTKAKGHAELEQAWIRVRERLCPPAPKPERSVSDAQPVLGADHHQGVQSTARQSLPQRDTNALGVPKETATGETHSEPPPPGLGS